MLTLDSIEGSEREEVLGGWLEKQGIENAWNLAPDLVDSGCTTETLDQIAALIPKPSLGMALARLTASAYITRLVDEIENSMKRIKVVREYDRAIPRMTVRGSGLNQVWTNLITKASTAKW